jgi:hypothetical protein
VGRYFALRRGNLSGDTSLLGTTSGEGGKKRRKKTSGENRRRGTGRGITGEIPGKKKKSLVGKSFRETLFRGGTTEVDHYFSSRGISLLLASG